MRRTRRNRLVRRVERTRHLDQGGAACEFQECGGTTEHFGRQVPVGNKGGQRGDLCVGQVEMLFGMHPPMIQPNTILLKLHSTNEWC
jgi:hypothetical protein